MSTARVVWITFCLGWAIFWLTIGWVFLPFLNLLFSVAAAGCALLPIGVVKPLARPYYRGDYPSSTDDPRFTNEEKETYFDAQARNNTTNLYPR